MVPQFLNPLCQLVQKTCQVYFSYLLGHGNLCRCPRTLRKFLQEYQKVIGCWECAVYGSRPLIVQKAHLLQFDPVNKACFPHGLESLRLFCNFVTFQSSYWKQNLSLSEGKWVVLTRTKQNHKSLQAVVVRWSWLGHSYRISNLSKGGPIWHPLWHTLFASKDTTKHLKWWYDCKLGRTMVWSFLPSDEINIKSTHHLIDIALSTSQEIV